MEILEDDHQRPVRGERLDEQAPCAEHLVAVAPLRFRRVAERDTDERRKPARVRVRVAGAGERIAHARQHVLLVLGREQVTNQSAQGQERDRGAVRQALRGGDRHAAADAPGEFLHQPRLSGSSGRGDGHELRAPLAEGAPRDEIELGEVVGAAEERRVRCAPLGEPLDERRRADRLALALHGEALLLAEAESEDGAARAFADEDGIGIGMLLQPRRDVHRVAGDEEVARAGLARRDHLAGIHADA